MAEQIPDVRLENVVKRFDDVVAVDGVSLEVPAGSFFALLGPSGCGKTTTLRMLGGFEEPDEGVIELGGRDVVGLPPYKRDVNTVFQSYALFPHLSVENVGFGLRRKGSEGRRAAQPRARGDAARGRQQLGKRKPRQLSGGQQQRIALARAIVNSPRVLLLDEPLGALDLKLRKQLQLELKRIQNEVGITFVHVTHDQEEAMTMADTIAVMNSGKVEQLGAPAELYERPGHAVRRRLPRRLEPARTAPRRRRPVRARRRAAIGVRPSGRSRPSRWASGRRRSGWAGGGTNRLSGPSRRSPTSASRPSSSSRRPPARQGLVQNSDAGAAPLAPGQAVSSPGAPNPPSSSTARRRHRMTDLTVASCSSAPPPAAHCSPSPACSPPAAATAAAARHDDRRHERRPTKLADDAPRSRTGSCTSTRTPRRSDSVARGLHQEDGHEGEVRRGHQRQRDVLREDPGAAVAGAGIDRDIIVMTDNSRFPGILSRRSGCRSSTRA